MYSIIPITCTYVYMQWNYVILLTERDGRVDKTSDFPWTGTQRRQVTESSRQMLSKDSQSRSP